MLTILLYARRAAGLLGCLLGLGLTGCILPVPTIPLNLPGHGHTYKVRDRANLPPAGEGILIVHTYYNYATERVDCYPIRNGQAVVPGVLDVRVMPMEMFGYLSWVVPTYYVFFINGHHAHVYPVMPGHHYWDEFWPLINDARHIYGLKPRPEVLRMFPSSPYEERNLLDEIESDMQLYAIQVNNSREEGGRPSREELRNEAQARLIVQYIHARRQALDGAPASRSAEAAAPTSQLVPRPADTPVARCGLTSRERAFRALEACDYGRLNHELDAGLDPDSHDRLSWTLLHRAVALGDIKAVQMLVDRGADINRRLPRVEVEGYSPLALAAGCGQVEILKYLESKGAKVIALGTGYTLMHAAADKCCDMQTDDGPGRQAVLAYLIEKGLDVNAVYKPSCGCPGGTPLDLALDHRKARTAKYLATHGGKRTRTTLWPRESEMDK